MPLINDINGCSYTEESSTIEFKHNDKYAIDGGNSSYFVGIDISDHVAVGGRLKIGFNIPWSIY